MKSGVKKLTPMMEQYYRIKEKYKDTLLFFRVGDFYELFDEDAKIASQELGIVLTSRDKKHPMAGVPHHAVFPYIKRLIEKGYKVAICEQVEDPSKARGLVKRDVIRVITPGTLIEEELLTKENNYLMALVKNGKFGLAFIDVSTGEFFTTSLESEDEVLAEILKYNPVECIIPESLEGEIVEELKKIVKIIHRVEDERFSFEKAFEVLSETLPEINLMELEDVSVKSCGAILSYVRDTLLIKNMVLRLQKYSSGDYMILDSTTLKNLEIFRNLIDGSRKGTLIDVLDKTVTAMGSRLLKKWLQRPLLNIDEIEDRLNAVEELKEKSFIRQNLREILKGVYDLERIVSRIDFKSANARDLTALKNSLKAVSELKKFTFKSKKLQTLIDGLDTLEDIVEIVESAIVDDPPLTVKEGGLIKDGFDEELDRLRGLKEEHERFIRELELRERRATGIEKLRVGYNSVIGYYIEVPKAKVKYVPKHYRRKQTLVNAERFTIPELEMREEKILACDERIKSLEYEIFEKIRSEIVKHVERIRDCAIKVAELDVLASLSEVAVLYNYTRPKVNEGYEIIIREGRHPTVELNSKFVPNDVKLDRSSSILIITGPNMSGKSTYLRQTALITILAQIGSFVPAKFSVIGVVDRIFTRIGSIDDITKGHSTFMVEMIEVGKILKNATRKSLILLDEVGKSTSTKDGLSLAWAIVEYIHSIGAKTLFATHYHELSVLENRLEGVKNYHFGVIEKDNSIVFDRKIRRGASRDSYGIKVAELANIPKVVINRAYEVLNELESDLNSDVIGFLKELAEIDVVNLTPIKALVELDRIVKRCREILRY
jgi:DNA mismatch repair protein MutS